MNILFLGAGGPAAVGAIKSLLDFDTQKEHKIISVDCDELAVGFHMSDESYIIPKNDDDSYHHKLKEIVDKENIDLILPTSDDIVQISMLKNINYKNINLFMSDYDVIATCHNKMFFYEKCKDDFPLPYTIDKPLFKKPIRGKGSRGVELIKNNGQEIYQEYLPGTEYTIDVFSDMKSNVLSVVPRIRLQTKAGISTKGKIVRDKYIEAQCRKLAKFLKLKGPSCIQMKEDEKRNPKFIEVNPRFGGGTYFTTLAGINFVKMIIDLIEGNTPIFVSEPKEITILRHFEEIVC